MNLGGIVFKPALIPTLVTFALLPVLLGLGFWQLDRAHQKDALLAGFKIQTGLPYVSLAKLDLFNPESRYRKVIVEGRYDSDHQVLLDNQLRGGQPGYHVYTPLRLSGRPEAVLINRGWVPWGSSRQVLPDLSISNAEVSLRGQISQPANPGLRLETARPAVSWPQVVQYVDYAQLASKLGYPLLPAVVLLAPEEASGYWRQWQPYPASFGPERHRGYAFQWFALALAVLAVYIAVNIQRRHPNDTR